MAAPHPVGRWMDGCTTPRREVDGCNTPREVDEWLHHTPGGGWMAVTHPGRGWMAAPHPVGRWMDGCTTPRREGMDGCNTLREGRWMAATDQWAGGGGGGMVATHP